MQGDFLLALLRVRTHPSAHSITHWLKPSAAPTHLSMVCPWCARRPRTRTQRLVRRRRALGRPLKVVLMSATLDAHTFTAYMEQCPGEPSIAKPLHARCRPPHTSRHALLAATLKGGRFTTNRG